MRRRLTSDVRKKAPPQASRPGGILLKRQILDEQHENRIETPTPRDAITRE